MVLIECEFWVPKECERSDFDGSYFDASEIAAYNRGIEVEEGVAVAWELVDWGGGWDVVGMDG